MMACIFAPFNNVVLTRRVDVGVLRMLGNVLQSDTGLLSLPGVHVPDRSGDTGGISYISLSKIAGQ
jgi:hypothetical protein